MDVVSQTLYRHLVQLARLAHKRFANSGYGSHCPQSTYYLGCDEAVDLVDQILIKRITHQRPSSFKQNIRTTSLTQFLEYESQRTGKLPFWNEQDFATCIG